MSATDAGDFVFRLSDGTEVLRLGKDGRSQIHGRLIEVDDGTAWRTFKEWLEHAKVSPPGEVIGVVK